MDISEVKNNVATKVKTAKDKITKKVKPIVTWCKDNPEMAITGVLGTLGGAIKIGSDISKYKNEHEHDKEVYDPRLQMWHPIKRKMSYKEELYYKEAIRSGAYPLDVLDSMRLLK